MTPSSIGKSLFLAGCLMALAGIGLMLAGKIPGLGRLPGDIQIKKDNFSLYFPITTCLLISLIVTVVARLFKK
jgi:hypothetical protein